MRGILILLFSICTSQVLALWLSPVVVSQSYVTFEGDERWKYWPLLERMNELVLEEAVPAYRPDLDKKVSPAFIDSSRMYRELERRPNPDYTNEFRTYSVERRRAYKDWYNGLFFSIAWSKTGEGTLQGKVIGIGPSYALYQDGYDLGTYGAYGVSIEDIEKHLSQKEIILIKKLVSKNCTRFTGMTRLFAPYKTRSQDSDSLFDVDELKSPSFFRSYRVYYDDSLTKRVQSFKAFETLQLEADTAGMDWNSKYLWAYPKWLFFDHLVFTTDARFSSDAWSIELQWLSVGLSGQDRNKQTKAFYMKPEDLKAHMTTLHWNQLLKDYSEGILLGFERVSR